MASIIAGVSVTILIEKKKRLLLLAFPLTTKSSFLKSNKRATNISYNVLIPFPHSSYLDGMLQCMSIKNVSWSHQRYHQRFKFAGKFWFQVIYKILMQNKQCCNEQGLTILKWTRMCLQARTPWGHIKKHKRQDSFCFHWYLNWNKCTQIRQKRRIQEYLENLKHIVIIFFPQYRNSLNPSCSLHLLFKTKVTQPEY